MTRNKQTIEVVTVNQERRRRWSAEEKAALVRETYEPGMNVSLVARKHGVGASQLFNWRKLEREGALTAVTAGESVVPASELAAARPQIRAHIDKIAAILMHGRASLSRHTLEQISNQLPQVSAVRTDGRAPVGRRVAISLGSLGSHGDCTRSGLTIRRGMRVGHDESLLHTRVNGSGDAVRRRFPASWPERVP